MMEEVKHEKCIRCKTWREPMEFLNHRGRKLKTCIICRNNSKKYREKLKFVKCELCEYKTRIKGNLKQHIKAVHNKIKDKECPHCDFKSSHVGTLNQHIKTVHNKIKDFECFKCGYKCCEKGNLKQHIKTCTGKFNGSSGEFKIINYLDELQIDYKYNTSFVLKNKNNNYLFWDFMLSINDEILFIEFNGRHHYKPVCFGGISPERAMENFEKQQEHDKLKDNYCKLNDYPLLWISYEDFDNIEKIVFDFIIKKSLWDGDRH